MIKKIVDNNITQLPSNISYVKYYLSDGTTVKINNYINPNTNPSDPTKYIKAIETDTGLKVVDYIINAGTGVYSCRGTYLGNSITNGSSSNIFSTNADYTKTYTSINEVYIFGTVINKVTIDISNVKAEHGLSLHIELNEKKILFDTQKINLLLHIFL